MDGIQHLFTSGVQTPEFKKEIEISLGTGKTIVKAPYPHPLFVQRAYHFRSWRALWKEASKDVLAPIAVQSIAIMQEASLTARGNISSSFPRMFQCGFKY